MLIKLLFRWYKSKFLCEESPIQLKRFNYENEIIYNSQTWPLIHLTILATFIPRFCFWNELCQWKNIMNMKWIWIWAKWHISVLAKMHILLPFYLILTRGPKFIVKKNLRVIFSWGCFLKWLSGVCSIKVLAKNHGSPYARHMIIHKGLLGMSIVP